MITHARQQRMVERFLEDEQLRGDLADDAATGLVNWAGKRAIAQLGCFFQHRSGGR